VNFLLHKIIQLQHSGSIKSNTTKIHGVDFPVINLNSEEHFLQGDENNIDIDIAPKVFYPKELPQYFKIIQEIKLTADTFLAFS
jgi:hypothetical protein